MRQTDLTEWYCDKGVVMEPYPNEYFQKRDPSDDELFYVQPRKVVHIDDHAINAVKDHFRRLLSVGGVYLDLMSSWRSHIPDDLQPQRVVGLGMNAEEMADNPQLDDYLVQNLNKKPELPFEDAEFDGALCTVSVQYLTQPVRVFQEVNRVLKPGAPFVVTFSNRCFPTKAVAVWLASNDSQHMALITDYFERSGNWSDIDAQKTTRLFADPLYAVTAKKNQA